MMPILTPSLAAPPAPEPPAGVAVAGQQGQDGQQEQLRASLREARESCALKDHQLAKLRRQLADAQEQADAQMHSASAGEGKAGGDMVEVEALSDELRVMRESFEKRLEDARQQEARARRRHEQRELELERALKESEEERTLLVSQLQRKTEQLRQQHQAQ